MYSKKFDEFQGTVSKSNSVYSGFKQDMDKVRMAFCNVSFLSLAKLKEAKIERSAQMFRNKKRVLQSAVFVLFRWPRK